MGAIESDGVGVGPDDATQGGVPGPAGSGRHGTPGQRLGPYEILGELGRGGMGVVYRARHATLGSDVALKVILAGRDAEPDAIKRFIREAKAAAQLAGHPGIVGVHDIGEFEGRVYFAMDLIEGASLEKLIDEQRVTPQQAAGLIEQAARAVHHAHQHGILHRDLKPANILVTGDGRAKVTDFGLAQVRAAGPEASRLTKSGQVLGTPAYMSPEQAESGSLDARADVWSLGATLYEALVGDPPFPGDTIYNVLAKVLRADPVPPRKRDPRVPRELETITLKCLEKPIERRYPTAEALAEDLARWTKGEAILARPPGTVERAGRWVRRRRAVVATAAIVLAGAATLVGVTVVPRWRAASQRAEGEAAARAEGDAALARKAAAQPFLDRGRDALERLDRLLGRNDWTRAQVATLAGAALREFGEAIKVDPMSAEAMVAIARANILGGKRDPAVIWCDRALKTDPQFGPALRERGLLSLEAYCEQRVEGAIGVLQAETAAGAALLREAARYLRGAVASGSTAEEQALAEALLVFAEGRWREAGQRLEAHARERMTDRRAWWWAAAAWIQAEAWDLALATSTEALRLRPRDPDMLMRRGLARVQLGHHAMALSDYDAAVAEAPQSAMLLSGRGNAKRAAGDLAGALADWDAALALAPRSAVTLNNRGLTKRLMGDIAGALADLDAALAVDPRFAVALSNRGLAKAAGGDAVAAFADFDAALTLDPKCGDALLNRGAARQAAGDAAGAIGDYSAALALDPRSKAALHHRGYAKQQAGDVPGALIDYDAALALDPRFKDALVNRGTARYAAGDLAGACADYDAALTLDSRSAAALSNRGLARAAAGNLAGALADYDAALALTPRHQNALVNRALAKVAMGRAQEALADFDAALALAPRDHSALYQRGVARLAAGDLPGALADLDAALALEPRAAAALNGRGGVRRTMGDFVGALADYDAALAIDPNFADALANRATARWRLGDLDRAAGDLERALAVAPSDWRHRASVERELANARAALAAQGPPK